MEGTFHGKRWTAVSNIAGLVSGIFLAVLFILLMIVDDFGSGLWLALFFTGFGLLIALVCGVSLYVNKRAFIRADENGLTGFCHLGLTLRCRMEDIDVVSCGGDMLTLKLKNGKQYAMYKLENAYAMGKYIKRHLPLRPLTAESRETLIRNVQTFGVKRKNCILGLILCFVVLFAGIFLMEWLTGGKDTRDFTAGDWQIFRVSIAAAVLLTAVIVVPIRRFARNSDALQRNREDLILLVLRTTPLPAGNARKVYISLDEGTPIRVTVCGLPSSEEVYYIVEAITPDYLLEKVRESGVYPAFYALQPELKELVEIQVEVL